MKSTGQIPGHIQTLNKATKINFLADEQCQKFFILLQELKNTSLADIEDEKIRNFIKEVGIIIQKIEDTIHHTTHFNFKSFLIEFLEKIVNVLPNLEKAPSINKLINQYLFHDFSLTKNLIVENFLESDHLKLVELGVKIALSFKKNIDTAQYNFFICQRLMIEKYYLKHLSSKKVHNNFKKLPGLINQIAVSKDFIVSTPPKDELQYIQLRILSSLLFFINKDIIRYCSKSEKPSGFEKIINLYNKLFLRFCNIYNKGPLENDPSLKSRNHLIEKIRTDLLSEFEITIISAQGDSSKIVLSTQCTLFSHIAPHQASIDCINKCLDHILETINIFLPLQPVSIKTPAMNFFNNGEEFKIKYPIKNCNSIIFNKEEDYLDIRIDDNDCGRNIFKL